MGNVNKSIKYYSNNIKKIDDSLFRNIFSLPHDISCLIMSEWLEYQIRISTNLVEEIHRWIIIQRRYILRNNIDISHKLKEKTIKHSVLSICVKEISSIDLIDNQDVDIMKKIIGNIPLNIISTRQASSFRIARFTCFFVFTVIVSYWINDKSLFVKIIYSIVYIMLSVMLWRGYFFSKTHIIHLMK